MTKKARLLIVEDEEAIRSGLVDVFIFHGFEVDVAQTGDEGLRKAQNESYDLILLDVMLPGINGYEILETLRSEDRDQAIIMLTAKSDDDDVIHGLSLGADDYVSKPFSIAQLVLRVQAVLRRAGFDKEEIRTLVFGTLTVDCINLSGVCIDSKSNDKTTTQAFTRREVEILQCLAKNQSRPVGRDELLSTVWGYAKDLQLETRTVDIHIAKLRRKIEPDPSEPRYLVTVRGAGYRLQPDAT